MEDNISKVLLLEQELHSYKEQYDKDIRSLQNKLADLEKRTLSMERSKEKTDFQYEQIMETLNKLNNVTIPNFTAQLEELKNKPAKRYDQIISSTLGGIFGAVGGVITGLIINQPK